MCFPAWGPFDIISAAMTRHVGLQSNAYTQWFCAIEEIDRRLKKANIAKPPVSEDGIGSDVLCIYEAPRGRGLPRWSRQAVDTAHV